MHGDGDESKQVHPTGVVPMGSFLKSKSLNGMYNASFTFSFLRVSGTKLCFFDVCDIRCECSKLSIQSDAI